MKHNLLVTLTLIAFFLLAQVFGLFLVDQDAQIRKEQLGNQTVITVFHSDTSLGARPTTTGFESFLYLAVGIALGTLLVLILAKYQKVNLWRMWFFIAVWIALSIALGVFIKQKVFFNYDVAILIALLLAAWKIMKPNILVHNITEVLMYAGIAVLIVPLFNELWAIILLLVISVYDIYAVWKSRHMVRMAKFQAKSNVFAGLMIPYKRSAIVKAGTAKSSATSSSQRLKAGGRPKKVPKTAILGGGDVVFPLIFSGVILEKLMVEGLTKSQAFLQSSIMILTSTVAISLLFFFAKKDKYYPAMPFITAGCLIGWVMVMLI